MDFLLVFARCYSGSDLHNYRAEAVSVLIPPEKKSGCISRIA
jgi:hypothetical protein